MTERSEAINELAAALAKAQGDFAPVSKSATNPRFGHSYATLDDIISATRKALSANGLAILQTTTESNLITTLAHSSGQWLSTSLAIMVGNITSREGRDVLTQAQAFGSALTYARRYALAALLNVAADEDDDANTSGTGKVPATKRPTPAVTPPAEAGQAADLCPVHGIPFREGRNGGFYCPRKLADGSWCKERPQKPADLAPARVQGEVMEEPDFDSPVGEVEQAFSEAKIPMTQATAIPPRARQARTSSLPPGSRGVQALYPVAWSRWKKYSSDVLAGLGGGTAADYAERDSAELEAQLATLWDAPKEG